MFSIHFIIHTTLISSDRMLPSPDHLSHNGLTLSLPKAPHAPLRAITYNQPAAASPASSPLQAPPLCSLAFTHYSPVTPKTRLIMAEIEASKAPYTPNDVDEEKAFRASSRSEDNDFDEKRVPVDHNFHGEQDHQPIESKIEDQYNPNV